MTTEFLIFGLARLTRICNPSADLGTLLKVMKYWKFSQKTKLKQKFFANSEKQVGNFSQDHGALHKVLTFLPCTKFGRIDENNPF